MKKIRTLGILAILLWSLGSCQNSTTPGQNAMDQTEDTATVVLRLQQSARIYSTEYRIHKILIHHESKHLQQRIITQKINIPLPSSSRKIAIPMDIVIKGYTDMNKIEPENIHIEGKSISITLPDPEFIVTSETIDWEHVIQTSDLLRKDFQTQEITDLSKQEKQNILKNIPWDDFLKTAHSNAAHTLFPLLQALGFEQIHIQYRDELKNSNPEKLLLYDNIENKAS